jgi:hypothetical protein
MKKKLTLAVLFAVALALGFSTIGDVNAAATLTGKVQIIVQGTLQNALDLVTATAPLSKSQQISFTNGFGAGSANMAWSDTRTLGTGTPEDIDLQASLTDAFGLAFTPVRMKALYIYSHSTNTTNLTIGGDANSVPFFGTATDTVVLKPGGALCLVDPSAGGYTVTAATGDIIQVSNAAGASATYDIVIIGSTSS